MSEQRPNSTDDHLENCPVCAGNDRGTAYRWLGERHWLPALHGANWLGQDLRRTIGRLSPGEQAVAGYGPQGSGAPQIAVHHVADGVIRAAVADHLPDAEPTTAWTWEAGEASTDEALRTILAYLAVRRGADGVTIVPSAVER